VIYYIWTPQIVVTIPENLEKLAKHRQVWCHVCLDDDKSWKNKEYFIGISADFVY
jgi:hypothetical protein